MQNNPVCKKISSYRKSIIAAIPTLRYLDDRPVFEDDRRYAEAYSRGGMDAERQERKVYKKEKDDEHSRNMSKF